MGGYMTPEEAEASSPYGGGGTPATRAEADAANVQGRTNREVVGLGSGYGGYSGEQLDTINQQREQEKRQQQEQDRLNYEQRARVNAGNRPGYTDESTLGDTRTQNYLKMRDQMAMMGMPVPDEDAFLGGVLEGQRKIAVTTPGTRDDQFFTNELTKWNHNPIELSSAYHDVGMNAGAPIPANPFENRGDVALAFEKGGNLRDFTPDRYGFNPNVGAELGMLPGGKGLQETAWTVAKTNQPANVDFQPAIDYQLSQKGKYGPYGYLAGGVVDKVDVAMPMGKEPIGMPIGSPRTDVSGQPIMGGKDWNPFVVSAAEPIGFISEGIQIGPTPQTEQLGLLVEEPKPLSVGGLISDFTKSFGQLKKWDAGGAYQYYTQGISRFSTRVVMPSAKGFGEYVDVEQAKTPTPVGTVVTGAAYAGEQIYTDIRKDPIQDIALYLLPLSAKSLEVGGATLTAKAVASKNALINAGGRALSSPAAIDLGNVIKGGLVGMWGVQSAINVNVAPNTPEGKGRAIGDVGYQVAMVGAGVPASKAYTPTIPENPSSGKTLFTGERKLPVTEKVMIRSGDWVNRQFQTKGQGKAIRDVSTEYGGKSSFTKPEVTTTEPDIAGLTHVGPENAPAVKAAMIDQPSVMYGSGTVKAQTNPKTPMGKVLWEKSGTSADADVFTEFPAVMEAKAGTAATGMDLHAFPEGYPNVGQGSNAPSQPGTYLFGNRYRVNPYADEITRAGKTPLYEGDINFEQLNVGFRKYSSAMRDDIADPMNKGYRLGKDLSRGTRSRDYLTEISQGRKPTTKQSSAYDRMLQQEITYAEMNDPITGEPQNIRTDTLWNIRKQYENNPKEIPDVFSTYSKGAVSTGSSPFFLLPVIPSIARVGASRSPSGSISPSLISKSASTSTSRSPSGSISPSGIGSAMPSPFISSGSTPPRYPPIVTPTPTRTPPSSPPLYAPSSVPYVSPYTPPPSITRTPPISPPYSPPSSPPYAPPPIPKVPGLPAYSLLPQGINEPSKKRRPRKFKELFPMGILAGVQAGYNLKTPKMARPKKGRLIPKSMLTPAKRRKK